MNIVKKIIDIKLPETDVYFERSSADGYAFLGNALQLLNINNQFYLEAIIERNFSLNAKQQILNVSCSKDNLYVYTHWVCYEYLKNLKEKTKSLLNNIKNIGTYTNGWHRYCSEEINYTVPNATSAACLLYAENNYEKEAYNLFTLLKNEQDNGNWNYYTLNGTNICKKRKEDNYHLGMMLYHFYRLKKFYYDEKLIINTLKNYILNDNNWMQAGSIGWGIPMAYLVYNLYKNELIDLLTIEKFNIRNNILQQKTINYLNHSNFRVRSIAAWALSIINNMIK